MILLAALLALQSSVSDKLPPANPVPYADPDTLSVMTPVNALLAAIAAHDAAAMRGAFLSDAMVTMVVDGAPAKRATAAQFAAAMPASGRIEHRLVDPAIEMDGGIAMIWSPYVVRIDGKVAQCGTDHFDLVRSDTGWRIAALTATQRTTGCSG